MQPEHVPVGDLFSRECLYTVRLFQRPYVWDEERWAPLWDDIARVSDQALAGAHRVRPHFLGSVVVQQLPSKIQQVPRREIIDGQQRLTTLQLLLKAVADTLELDEATADAARPLRPLLRHPYAPKADPEGVYKVWPTNADRGRFRAVMEANAFTKMPEGDRFAGAYAFYRKQIRRWLTEGGSVAETRAARADALATTLRQRLWLVALNLAEDDQAQIIFETLNARGTPLLPADLIKNLLLRQAEAEKADTTALYTRYWQPFDDDAFWQEKVGSGYSARPRLDLFMQQALTLQTRQAVPMGQLYDIFAEHVKETQGTRTATDHLAGLSRLAQTARPLYGAEEGACARAHLAAARLRAMEFHTALPVLLLLCADPLRDPEDVAQASIWLESFLVRRMVCGLNTGMYGLMFVDLLAAIADATPAAPALAAFLLQQRSDSARWPDDDAFGQAWRSVPLYRTLKRGRLGMLLRALEAVLRDPKLTDPVPVPKTLHVEHVMPRAWQAYWPLPLDAPPDAGITRDRLLHTIGNLTLVTQRLNEKMSNAPWTASQGVPAKRPELIKHGLLMLNKEWADHGVWNEQAIQERSQRLFQKALSIWPRPTAPHR